MEKKRPVGVEKKQTPDRKLKRVLKRVAWVDEVGKELLEICHCFEQNRVTNPIKKRFCQNITTQRQAFLITLRRAQRHRNLEPLVLGVLRGDAIGV